VPHRHQFSENTRGARAQAFPDAGLPDRGIGVDALPSSVTAPPAQTIVAEHRPANPTLDLIERAYILWVLRAESGNKARAAEVLGIDPSTLYRKLNRYGLSE
jgi:DNA-binding NtrC family response regulator